MYYYFKIKKLGTETQDQLISNNNRIPNNRVNRQNRNKKVGMKRKIDIIYLMIILLINVVLGAYHYD